MLTVKSVKNSKCVKISNMDGTRYIKYKTYFLFLKAILRVSRRRTSVYWNFFSPNQW